MIYKKYEFETLPEILQPVLDDQDEQIRPHSVNGSVVVVGKLTLEEGTYDEEGNELTPPVISDKIAVDILWNSEPLEELEPYRVTPTTPKHTIAGMEKLYTDGKTQ